MNWLELLEQFIKIVVFPCLGLLSVYLIKLINTKSQETRDKLANDKADKYVQLFEDT